jgi:DNA topoisomerase VI subunit A
MIVFPARCALCAFPKNEPQAAHARLVRLWVGTCAIWYSRITAQLFKVMDLIHEAIVDGVPATKRFVFPLLNSQALKRRERDMYYKDVALFKKQNVVDNVGNTYAMALEFNFVRS